MQFSGISKNFNDNERCLSDNVVSEDCLKEKYSDSDRECAFTGNYEEDITREGIGLQLSFFNTISVDGGSHIAPIGYVIPKRLARFSAVYSDRLKEL